MKNADLFELKDELYDKLNIKTVCETFVDYITEKTSIVEILDILLDELDLPEMKSKYIKAIQSEYGTVLDKLKHLTYNEAQLKFNVLRISKSIDEDLRCMAALEIANNARHRFLEKSEMLIIIQSRDVLQHQEAPIEAKNEACFNIFYTAVLHGFKKPYLMPHIHAKDMISQSFIFRYDSEPRYTILRCFADNNEMAALLAGDYYSNTHKLAEAAKIYIQQTQSPTVMTDIGLFLSKNRKYLKKGNDDNRECGYSEDDVIAAFSVMKGPLDKKIKPIIESNDNFAFLNCIKTDYIDLDMAFKILYIYAIKENDGHAAAGALALLKRNEVVFPDDTDKEDRTKKDAIIKELSSIAESKANLIYLDGSTTGLVNDLVVRKEKKLPHTGDPEKEISDLEYAELKENLEFLSSIFPKATYNSCRLRYQESIDYNIEFDYAAELKLLGEVIEMIPKEDNYYQFAKNFYKDRGIEYHLRELKKLENDDVEFK